MKNVIKKYLAKISGNNLCQRILKKNVAFSQQLMGIGAGTNVDDSGENKIFDVLFQLPPLHHI